MTVKRVIKVVSILLMLYAGLVVLFESSLGYFQPEAGGTILITTIDSSGKEHSRVVSRFESGDALFIAANHWPRAWFRRVLKNPELTVSMDGKSSRYRAVLLEGSEHERLAFEYNPGLLFRFLTGFPPRYFLRLDPIGQ